MISEIGNSLNKMIDFETITLLLTLISRFHRALMSDLFLFKNDAKENFPHFVHQEMPIYFIIFI